MGEPACLVYLSKGVFCMSEIQARTKRKPLTGEARQRDIERQRRFRREHPDKCREYRRRYIVRAAARLLAEDAERGGGSE